MSTLGYLKVTDDDEANELRRSAVCGYAEAQSLGEVEFAESAKGSWKPVRLDWLIEEKCLLGDLLIVPDLATIVRSIQKLHQILSAMKERGITLRIVDRDIVVKPEENEGPARLSLASAALFARFEREIIMASTKEAIKATLGKTRRKPRPAGQAR